MRVLIMPERALIQAENRFTSGDTQYGTDEFGNLILPCGALAVSDQSTLVQGIL